jgi:hypothetical protein
VDAIAADDIPTYMESQLTPLFDSLPHLQQLLMHAAEYPCPPNLIWELPSLTNIHWVTYIHNIHMHFIINHNVQIGELS